MNQEENKRPEDVATSVNSVSPADGTSAEGTPKKRRPRWLRIASRVFLGILIFIILIPVIIYIPPVQTLLKNVACKMVYNSTGMKIRVDEFRLRFPVDVTLEGVSVVEASGDTMAHAREALVDLKMAPLFQLDLRVKKLRLRDGYYRMLSEDSSMLMKVRARELDVDPGSSVDIENSVIDLTKARLAGGDISLYMNVWKQKPTPPDTAKASTPFLIKARNLELQDIRFSMSMLPTIDTLVIKARRGNIRDAVIDLRKNTINASLLALDKGAATYITPTAEWVKNHPAPPPLPSTGPPMKITADSASLTNFRALYATRGVKPTAGFDPAYIEASGINIGLRGFYNESSAIRLPITRLEARERCGLQITSGSGTVDVDSTGIVLDALDIHTPFSKIKADAFLSYGMMAMESTAPMSVKGDISLGIDDLLCFMPSLRTYLRMLPTRREITAKIDASGSLSSLNIPGLMLKVPGLVNLTAKGRVDNPMDMKKIRGKVDIDGTLIDSSPVLKLADVSGFSLPPLTIRGTAEIDRDTYGANLKLLTSDGDVAAVGKLTASSEIYNADVSVRNLNVGRFMPSLGIGHVTGSVIAKGHGFNPLSPSAETDAHITLTSLEYNGMKIEDVLVDATVDNGLVTFDVDSRTPGAICSVSGTGSIDKDTYNFDVTADLADVDLQTFGLSKEYNTGTAYVHVSGSANPTNNLYDVDLRVKNVIWTIDDELIRLPQGVDASFHAGVNDMSIYVRGGGVSLDFSTPTGLDSFLSKALSAATTVSSQIAAKRVQVDTLQATIPQFNLNLNASGRGFLAGYMKNMGYSADTVALHLENKDIISGNIALLGLNTGSLQMDTVTLSIKERGNLIDYRTHIGNRPSTMDGEFADVNLNGYVGGNRASLLLRQKNAAGETGYRIGLTAAFLDSCVNLHFTPLNATIGYMPWTLNDDNFVQYDYDRKVEAKLLAESNNSGIKLLTETNKDGDDQLHLNLDNIRIQDFLNMSVTAPPMAGVLNSDIIVNYKEGAFTGKGSMNLSDFYYNNHRVGDFDLDLNAGLSPSGGTNVSATLDVNGRPALTAGIALPVDTAGGAAPYTATLKLQKFPLSVANSFLPSNTAVLKGSLIGELSMVGGGSPRLNGNLLCDSVSIFLPMAGTDLKFMQQTLVMKDNVISFDNFEIFAANDNPLTVNGKVDLDKMSDPSVDLSMRAQNMMLVNGKKRPGVDMYGKLLVNLTGSAKGPMSRLDVNAALSILNGTDVFYTIPQVSGEIAQTTSQDVVKFVQFSDTTAVNAKDSVVTSSLNMRITAGLNISNGVRATVNLSPNGSDRVELTPHGSLNYFQNYMGDMRLNGQLNLGNGYVRYAIPVVGDKTFKFDPESYVLWNGEIMNPVLNILADDVVKCVVKTDAGNSRLVNFLVNLSVTNNLAQPKIVFDLSTDDDLTIQNELQSMSPDQRSTQAMNLLLYGAYTGANSKTSMGGADEALYSFLESKLNSWAANNIRGVDLSFGIDQYDQTINGRNSSTMSYSYQISKSLFNNRFKIVVGGNYTTDPQADENFAENLFSDVSFEYMIKQTNTRSLYARLFRHTGWQDILEGEVTEMGVGFVLRQKLDTLRNFFRFLKKRRRRGQRVISPPDSVPANTLDTKNTTAETAGDTLDIHNRK